MAQILLFFCQSVEISPNLVTLEAIDIELDKTILTHFHRSLLLILYPQNDWKDDLLVSTAYLNKKHTRAQVYIAVMIIDKHFK